MAIIHINKESLVKKWKEFYGEDFSKEYKGLSDSISDEVIIEKEGVIIFRGTQEELTQFVIDAQKIANYILLDVEHDNISEDETPNLAVDTYQNFGFKYGKEINLNELPESQNGKKLVRFKEWVCEMQFGKYPNGRTAIELVDYKTYEPIATATVNVPGIPLKENEIIIKNYSENQGMFQALFNAGIVKLNRIDTQSEWVDFHICELLIEPKFE